MNWHGLRWPVVALAFAGSLLAIWGGQRLVNQYDHQVPLRQAVQADKSVVSYTVSDQGQSTVFQVRFQAGGNLEEEWQQLNSTLKPLMGGHSYRIEPLDNPDPKLNEVYYNSQYALYEAQERGTFQAMADRVGQEAKAAGVKVGLYVDDQNIYLDLSDGAGSLQRIFPRSAAPAAANSLNG
ncbi:MAG TPA: hypothetical protein VMW83_06750 [Spirochaetia bacterium]|nr:hypothetical protein [Spirochaetia bacterium]